MCKFHIQEPEIKGQYPQNPLGNYPEWTDHYEWKQKINYPPPIIYCPPLPPEKDENMIVICNHLVPSYSQFYDTEMPGLYHHHQFGTCDQFRHVQCLVDS